MKSGMGESDRGKKMAPFGIRSLIMRGFWDGFLHNHPVFLRKLRCAENNGVTEIKSLHNPN